MSESNARRRLLGPSDVSEPPQPARDRVIDPKDTLEDEIFGASLRPRSFGEYVGQDRVVESLRIAIAAAKQRDEPLEHVLFYGPPGLGKTTLAQILANEMGSAIKISSGPLLEKKGDVTALLTSLDARDFFFLDEIHRLPPDVEEMIYSALEDFRMDILIGTGPGARTVGMDIKRFTAIGATTRQGLISAPLRGRFGLVLRLNHYDQAELAAIVSRSARLLDVAMDADGANEIARRSRGTPRIANRLLRRVRDYAQVRAGGRIDIEVARKALDLLEVDPYGLDEIDQKIMRTLLEKYGGGPVGLNTISASIDEEADTIEEVYEPYLLQLGFLDRTPRGRMATERAFDYFQVPRRARSFQNSLF